MFRRCATFWLSRVCAAVRVWRGQSRAVWAPQCRSGLRVPSRVCRSFAMPLEEGASDIAQLLPRGHRPQDIAGDARARARAARISSREGALSWPRSPGTPPLRSPSVDSEANVSPTLREGVVLWGRSIADHWASDRTGRAPSGMVAGAGWRGDRSLASVAADGGAPADSGAKACAAIEALGEASGDIGHQPRVDSGGEVREHLATAAPGQLVIARGDVVGSESRAVSPRVEEAAAPLATATGSPSEAQTPLLLVVSESDSDSLMIVTPPQRRVRGRGRGARGRR